MGEARVDWRGQQVIGGLDAARLVALTGAAGLIQDDAVERTPVETGLLKGTAKVSDNGKDQAAVSYNTKYARRQHEELGYRHPGGGEAKFLENAASAQTSAVRALIARELGKALK